MTRDTRRAGTFLVALGGVVAMLVLMAGPAAADSHDWDGKGDHKGDVHKDDGHKDDGHKGDLFPDGLHSGGAVAVDGSVASGEAHAARGSTASGDATAVRGSVASGCSLAINKSTASGDDHCDRDKHDFDKDKDKGKGHGGGGGGGVGGGATVRPAAATSARLAFTGPSMTTQLAALAGLAVALGVVLTVSASERRRVTSRA